MQRKVEKVFKALSKKGMVRAFIETDKNEYVYPLISRSKPGNALKKIYILVLGMIILVLVGITVYNLLVEEKLKETESVSQRISPDRQDRYGMTLLHHAVIRTDMIAIRNLIENGAGVDFQDEYGWTPLHWAIFKQDEHICRFLLQCGASTTISTTQSWFKFPAGISAGEMAKITKNKVLQAILLPGKNKKIKEKKNEDFY